MKVKRWITQRYPWHEWWHSWSRSLRAWPCQNQILWGSIVYLTVYCSILYPYGPLLAPILHVNKLSCQHVMYELYIINKHFMCYIINQGSLLKQANKVLTWVIMQTNPLAVPIAIFILKSQVRGLLRPISPCNHCSKLPLSTYSYTSILLLPWKLLN